jgi:hypothetical protein
MPRLADDVVDMFERILRHARKKPVHDRTEEVRGIVGRSELGGGGENEGHPEHQRKPVFAESARHGSTEQHSAGKSNWKNEHWNYD